MIVDKNKFNNFRSPVNTYQFIWFGMYANGNHVSEFDFSTHKENWFNVIKREDLLTFGLMGFGHYLNYLVPTGTFNLHNGMKIDVIFKSKDGKYYNITNNSATKYNDCISYKDVESTFNPQAKNRLLKSNIYQYNFGYKAYITTPIANFYFKPILTISMERKPMFMTFRLSSDRDIDGEVLVVKNGKVVQVTEVNMHKNVAGETNWIVK